MSKRKAARTADKAQASPKYDGVRARKYESLFALVKPIQVKLDALWKRHGMELASYHKTRYEMGQLLSEMMEQIQIAKFPGGFKAFHKFQGIAIPRVTCLRYAGLYKTLHTDVGMKAEVLDAAFEAGIDPVSHVAKISTHKKEVQKMDGPRFVSFLQQKAAQKRKPKSLEERVSAAMQAMDRLFKGLEVEQVNQAYTLVAFKISKRPESQAFSECKFIVGSDLAIDELESLDERAA